MRQLYRHLIVLGILAIIIPLAFSSLVGASSNPLDSPISEPLAAPGDPVVDNSASAAFPPIGSQGGLSSCVGWATTYYQLTYETALARGWNAASGDANRIFSPKWTYNMINAGSDGNTTLENAYALLSKNGAVTLADFPYSGDATVPANYQAWCLSPSAWLNAVKYRASATTISTGVDDIKTQLANNHVLVFATYVQSWVQKTLGNDPATSEDDAFAGQMVATYINNTQKDLHSMTIVGYNDNLWCDLNGNGAVDAGERGAFKIANSRGTGDWNHGFRWVSYDALRASSAVPAAGDWPAGDRDSRGIFLGKVYRMTVNGSYSPQMVAEVTLNARFRDQVAITLGVGAAGASRPSATWNSFAVYNTGGPYAFDGSTTARDGTFYFDYNDILSQAPSNARWFIGIANSGNNAVAVKSFRILRNNNPVASASNLPATVTGGQTWFGIDFGGTAPTTTPTTTPPPTSQKYSLTISITGKGSVTKSPSKSTYSSGAEVQLTAKPNSGWIFQGWSGDLEGKTNPIKVTMDANKKITATFVRNSTTTATSTPTTHPPSGGGGGGGGGGYVAPPPPTQLTVSVSGFTPATSITTDLNGATKGSVHLQLSNNQGSLDISEGTVLHNASGSPISSISANVPSSLPTPPEENVILCEYIFGPDGAQFNPPLKLSLKYDPAALPINASDSDLYLAYMKDNAWVKLPSQVNMGDKTITADISHFSQYALMVKLPPAKFDFSNLTLNLTQTDPGIPIMIQTTVTNTGGLPGIPDIILKVNGIEENKQSMNLEPGKTATIQFQVKKDQPGDYNIDINGKTGSFTVLAPPPKTTAAPTSEPDILSPTTVTGPANSQPEATANSVNSPTPQGTEPVSKLTIPLKWVIAGLAAVAMLVWLVIAIRNKKES